MSDYENAVGQREAIKDYVEMHAAPTDVQYRWLVDEGYPTAELWNQLGHAVPYWFDFLREHDQIAQGLEDALLGLMKVLEESDHGIVWGDELISLQQPEWDVIRDRAREVLLLF
jgi:hypothetical protein